MHTMTYDEVKRALKCNDKTLAHWAATGELRPIDQSGCYDGRDVGMVKLVLAIRRG